ncbi:hypothetical protein [Streptomyces silvisoli]|uniref:Secreted protein n=1 Tax=Streptomyces silvisoli TaxID=3034235 RepID=A0ABT5ZVV5_9ACTN|nr:hypothetical protein [Streptomyces silvisoli]MDF3293954.1 hypothetical protein [Streptomyces silvisoli]
MRRGLVHTGAWALATGAAIGLSWYGVHTVLAGTAYDPPRALPISGAGTSASALPSISPETSSTHRPRPQDSSAPPPSPSQPAAPQQPPGQTQSTGNINSYTVNGGRVAIDLGPAAASLVSATPNAGWSMQVWKQNGWLRVDFTSDGHASSVFCTWNGHAPTVQTYES